MSAPAPPPYLVAGIVTIFVLGIYVVTLAPTTQFWDTSEYIAAAKVLGIPHPPGNPLFVLIAHVWALIPWAGSYAVRINLLAAVTTACAAGFLFLVTDRMVASTIELPQRLRRLVAVGGTVVGATSFTVWNQATVNEKTYTISLLSITLVLWLIVRWADLDPGSRRERHLVLIAYLLALTTGNHLMGLLVGPAVAVYVLWSEPRVLIRWQFWLPVAAVVLVAFSIWIFLPIRAAHHPPINEGEPITWPALKAVLAREQYQKPPVWVRQADFLSQMGNYFQYFTWQFGRDWAVGIRRVLATGFGLLGLVGAFRQWRRDRRAAVAMTALMFVVTVVLVYYLDFKYGYSYAVSGNVPREVRERDYFFVASFLLWGTWTAIGCGVALESLAAVVDRAGPAERRGWFAAPALVICLIPLLGNRISASRAGETLPRDFAVDLLQSVEPYGILITAGDNDTFPLWYAQEVEGVRQDVVVANQSLMNTDWHLRQLAHRPVFPFDSAHAVAPYRGRSWPRPRAPLFTISDAQLVALPEVYPLSRRSEFHVDSLAVTLRPMDLVRSDLATFQLIRDNLGKRPIYFSRTTGSYADEMGFTPYLLTQGLVRRVEPAPITAGRDIVNDQRFGWVDLARTRTLLFDVYHVASATRPRPLGWIDRPSEGMLIVYGIEYAIYGELAKERGDTTGAARADSLARLIFGNTSVRF